MIVLWWGVRVPWRPLKGLRSLIYCLASFTEISSPARVFSIPFCPTHASSLLLPWRGCCLSLQTVLRAAVKQSYRLRPVLSPSLVHQANDSAFLSLRIWILESQVLWFNFQENLSFHYKDYEGGLYCTYRWQHSDILSSHQICSSNIQSFILLLWILPGFSNKSVSKAPPCLQA